MSIPKNRWPTLLIVGLALVLRLLWLGIKPPHFDEGVNGWFVDQMTKNGYFHYDPTNYHGPLHFYILFLAQTLFGRHIWTLRMPIVLISSATVYLVLNFDRFIGTRASRIAALAMAVSPGAVFYGRYAIHESELVLFLILAAWAIAGLWKFGTKQYLWALSLALTGMILTKETYVIHVTAFVLSAVCVYVLEKLSHSSSAEPMTQQQWTKRDLACCFIAAIALIVFFYSGNLLDFKSLKGLYQCYVAWFHTGEKGNGHEKVWYYWIWPLIVRYEWVALIGLAGVLYNLLPNKNRLIRYLAIYGTGTLTAYSIVHYKTPWCIISLLWPFFFVFGDLAARLIERVPQTATLICATLFGANAGLTIWLNYYHYTDEREPYVYVQTLPDLAKLTKPLLQLAKDNPENYHLDGHIIVASYHPLPWLLGDFDHVGYYGEDLKPSKCDADFLLVQKSRIDEVEHELKEDYFT